MNSQTNQRTNQRGRSNPGIWRRLVRLFAISALALSVGVRGTIQKAQGAAFFWTSGGATYNWSEGANWSTGVAPANDGSSDLFFGALNVPYLTRANIPGSSFIGSLFGSHISGGEIDGMTFLPAAGAYDVQYTPVANDTDGILIRAGGIYNESPQQQTFNTPIYVDERFGATLTAANGGLRFNEIFGSLADGNLGVTLTGSGPITFAKVFSSSHTVTKSGSGTTTIQQGFSVFLDSFNVNAGAVNVTGNVPSGSGAPGSTTNALVLSGNSSFSLSGGAKLFVNNVSGTTGLQVNSGTLAVSGSNSSLSAAREVQSAPLITTTIGNGGTGSLSFSSQATGAFDSIIIGGSGTGNFSIQSPAAVTGANATIGLNVGASGSATVNGPNATWTNTSDIVVGQSGNGSLDISGGARVTSLRGHVGFNANSNGSVVVRDDTSSWTGSGSFFIGNGGSGSLQVLNGALASTAGNSYLGFSAGASGTGLVSGLGSTWNTDAIVAIGGNLAAAGGQGSLRIENSGTVITNGVLLYNSGVIELSGATNFVGPITSYGGLVRSFEATELSNDIALGSGGIHIAIQTAGGVSNFSGNISGGGALETTGVSSDATLKLTGINTYTGPTTVNGGALFVDGSITSPTTVHSGATLGGSGTVGTIDLLSGATLAPGNSPGLLSSGNTILRADSSYQLDLRSDGSATAGIDWDSLAVAGSLDISNLTAANPLNLRLRTLDAANDANPLDVWDPGLDHTWSSFVSTTDGLTGAFDPSLFQVDTTDFLSPIQGDFSVVQDGNNLDLQYVATVVDQNILVSNLSESVLSAKPIGNNPNPNDPPEGSTFPWYWGAQAFSTDSQQYQLSSIDASVGDGSSSPAPVVVAELHADDTGTIGPLIATFTAPDVSGTPAALTFLPDGAVTLDADSTYWFVLGSEAPGDGTFLWEIADSTSFVGPGSLGSFADSEDSGTNWNYGAESFPYFLQVNVDSGNSLSGDFDHDGDVDGNDFLVWQRGGSPHGVGSGDLALWQAHYGQGAGSSSTPVTAVPEPGPLSLTFIGLTLFFALPRNGTKVWPVNYCRLSLRESSDYPPLSRSERRQTNQRGRSSFTAPLAILLAAVTVLFSATIATAATRYWGAGNGNWSTAGNWTPAGVPAGGDTVNIHIGGAPLTVTYDYSGAPVTLDLLSIDKTDAGTAANTLSLAANTLTSNTEHVGANGRGTLNQDGGLNTIAAGAGYLDVGVYAGSTGTYNLSGTGSLVANTNEYIGDIGSGVFNQTGGTNTITPGHTLYLGYNENGAGGTYNLSGGSLSVGDSEYIGWHESGTLTQTGGTHTTDGAATLGSAIGTTGSATVTDAGSTWTINNYLSLGFLLGSGSLLIENGGQVSDSDGGIGAGFGGTGSAIVTGAGSTWTNSGNLRIGPNPSSGDSGYGTLTIGPGGTVFVGDTLSLTDTAALTDSAALNLAGGTLRLNVFENNGGTINYSAGTVQLAGDRSVGPDPTITEFFGPIPAIVAGKGLTVEGTATLSQPLSITGGAFKANGLVIVAGGVLDFDRGLLELTGGGTISGLASLVVPTGSEFRASGMQAYRVNGSNGSTITATGDLTLGNAMQLNGFYTNGELAVGPNTVTLADANDAAFDTGALATLGDSGTPGTLVAANGMTLNFGGNIAGFGTVDTPDNPAKPFVNNGNVIGDSVAEPLTLTGYVKGVGTYDNVQFTGTFAPGFSPAKVNLGSATYDGDLQIEIGGLSPGSGYDQLNHILGAGLANLGGTLDVSLINGFQPSLGDTFEIITALGGVQSTFANLMLPSLGSGLGWEILYGTNSVQLEVASAGLSGDFDHDGDVDGNDFLVWQRGGSPNGNGINSGDLALWQAQYGQGAGSSSTPALILPAAEAASPVPEPSSLVIWGIVLFFTATLRSRGPQKCQA